jgi:hypothetical protein
MRLTCTILIAVLTISIPSGWMAALAANQSAPCHHHEKSSPVPANHECCQNAQAPALPTISQRSPAVIEVPQLSDAVSPVLSTVSHTIALAHGDHHPPGRTSLRV